MKIFSVVIYNLLESQSCRNVLNQSHASDKHVHGLLPASQRNVKFADTVLLDKYVGWLACKICLECLLRKMPSFPFYSFSSLSIRKKNLNGNLFIMTLFFEKIEIN